MSARLYHIVVAAGLCTLVCAATATPAPAVLIDDFQEATNTKSIPPTQVTETVQGSSTSATDTGLPGVVGGVRTVVVSASLIGDPSEYVNAGVDTFSTAICYNSTDNADGSVALIYDKGGLGLDLDLSEESGLLLIPLGVDPGSGTGEISYTLTLEDSVHNVVSSSITNTEVCIGTSCHPIHIPFANFLGIDLRHLFRVTLTLDPSPAADVALATVVTYGSHLGTPLLSPGLLGMLVAILAGVGLVDQLRRRATRD